MIVLDTDHLSLLEWATTQTAGQIRAFLTQRPDEQVTIFDEPAAVQFQRLKGIRVRIGSMDLKIAAITLAYDALLLTRNFKDFFRVPGLRFVDATIERPSP